MEVSNVSVSATFKHLIVLSHGMNGTYTDLNYLEELLLPSTDSSSWNDVKVFKSAKNSHGNSLKGVRKGSEELVSEITEILKDNSSIETISFVGNSLGGVYARFAISLLYDSSTNSFINNIKPLAFITIATPHLGVNYGQNYIESDLQFYVPGAIKYFVSSLFSVTGRDMFMLDEGNMKHSILYKLATEDQYLLPLKAFKYRRLYANLQNDFMVSLPTASVMAPEDVVNLRNTYKDTYGIVTTLHTTVATINSGNEGDLSSSDTSTLLSTMRSNLNSLGWSKVIVNFKGIFPMAHNKIAAVTKFPLFFWNMFNFHEGSFVMEDLAQFLRSSIGNVTAQGENSILTHDDFIRI